MKLRLDENLFEDYLYENNSLLSLLSNRSYKPRGFWGTSYGKQALKTTLGEQLYKKGFQAHHINGIHPTSSNSDFNDITNIAIVSKAAHDDLTKANNDIVKETLEKFFGDALLGKYIVELITYSINKNIKLEDYLELKENKYSEIISEIIFNIETNFYDYRAKHSDDVYLLTEILSERE